MCVCVTWSVTSTCIETDTRILLWNPFQFEMTKLCRCMATKKTQKLSRACICLCIFHICLKKMHKFQLYCQPVEFLDFTFAIRHFWIRTSLDAHVLWFLFAETWIILLVSTTPTTMTTPRRTKVLFDAQNHVSFWRTLEKLLLVQHNLPKQTKTKQD